MPFINNFFLLFKIGASPMPSDSQKIGLAPVRKRRHNFYE